jgi:hypothetical protein
MIPKKCHLWTKANIVSKDIKVTIAKEYWDHSHEWRSLVKCDICGQLYIDDNVEVIDWIAGNDKIYSTLVPVSAEELSEYDFSKISSFGLLYFSPVLLLQPDDSLKWVGREE